MEKLAIHGFLGSPYDFDFPVRTPYWLPAHGPRSPLAGPMTLRSLAHDFDETLRPTTKDLLVGYSLGGRVLMTWAVDQALKGQNEPFDLVLISCSPGLSEDERPARLESDARWANLLTSDPDRFAREWKAQTLFSPASPARLVTHPEGQARLLKEASPAYAVSLWKDLPGLKGRMIYVCGSEDKKYVEIGRRLVDVRPGTEVVIFEGAHHDLHITHAEKLKGLLQELSEKT